MLFWTRALLCIGTVTIIAVQRLPQNDMSRAVPSLAGPTAALAGDACRVRPDLCAAAVTRALGALAPVVVPPNTRGPMPGRPRTSRRAPGRDLPVALGVRSLT